MTNVAIDTHAFRAMAVDTPAHRLIDLSTYAVHLADLAVTRRAFESRSNVRLVRVKDICLGFMPIHSSPLGLLLALGECRELVDLGTLGHHRVVAAHARSNVWNSRVRRLIH